VGREPSIIKLKNFDLECESGRECGKRKWELKLGSEMGSENGKQMYKVEVGSELGT
jgi:hypothetical protein